MDNRNISPVSFQEHSYVGHGLLEWLNEYPNFPPFVSQMEYERLGSENGMSIFATMAAYKTEEYISGAYNAQYQFSIIYRTSTDDSEERLDAAAILSDIATWAESRADLPNLGEGKKALSVERTTSEVMSGRNEDETEDYQILMVMSYKVWPYNRKDENNV